MVTDHRAWLKVALLAVLAIAAPRHVEAGAGVLTPDGRLRLLVNFRFPSGQDLLEPSFNDGNIGDVHQAILIIDRSAA